MLKSEDILLLAQMAASLSLREHGIAASHGEPDGVLILERERPVGLWTSCDGHYQWRYLGNMEPVATALTSADCVKLTALMARYRSWQEPPADCTGPLPCNLMGQSLPILQAYEMVTPA